MKRAAIALAFAVLVVSAGPAAARLHRSWSYPELTKAAELIVIASPGATIATGKRETLPGISTMEASGATHPVEAEREDRAHEGRTGGAGRAARGMGRGDEVSEGRGCAGPRTE